MVLDFLSGLSVLGYPGVFLISLIGSSTVVFPVPFQIIIFSLATTLNPIALTLVSAIGAAIGEMVSFFIGKYGRKAFVKKQDKWLKLLEKWFHRNGFLTIIFVTATPLPTDIAGILAGALGYDKTKFFLAVLIGKIIVSSVIVYAGFYSIPWISQYLGS